MEQEIHNRKNGETKEAGDQDCKWVHDSSIDYKGNSPVRASTGAWKASLFIIGKAFIAFFFSSVTKHTSVRCTFCAKYNSLVCFLDGFTGNGSHEIKSIRNTFTHLPFIIGQES